MVAVLIYAGLRREELRWLTLDDYDKTTGPFGMIRVRTKTIDGNSWQPKTKSNRAVPISSALRKYLDRYQPRLVPNQCLFHSPDAKWWDPDNFSQGLAACNSEQQTSIA
jgi:hypothetical protein